MITAVGKHILVRQLREARVGQIWLPKSHKENSAICIIESVGDKVKDKTIIKHRTAVFNLQAAIQPFPDKRMMFFKEDDIILINYKGMFRPLGNRILVRRDIEEHKTKAGVWIPGCYQTKDQTLEGFYHKAGVRDDKVIETFDIRPGDRVQIQKWDASIHEVGMDEYYYLSVPTKLISHKIENVT